MYSILFNKCPRCQEGDFFEGRQAFNLKTFDRMHKKCPVCGQDYEPEPGFYFGAMYVSYALYVAFTISTFVLLVVLLDVDVMNFLYFLLPCIVLLTPYFFRVARRTWINFFVSYKPDKAAQQQSTLTGSAVNDEAVNM